MNRRNYLRSVGAGAVGLSALVSEGARSAEAMPTAAFETEVVASDLVIPWGAAFRGDTLYVTERPGYLTKISDDGYDRVADFTDETATRQGATSGLCGLAFRPDDQRIAYMYQSYRGNDGDIYNRILAYDLANEKREVIFDGISGSYWQDGGRLLIENGALYATTGQGTYWDTQNQAVQDTSTLVGKTLRLTLEGEPHPGNPFGNAVYTLGHRNPEGLAVRRNGQLFGTEHGPSYGDEINLLKRGNNYGWPEVMGESDDERFTDPLVSYTPTIAPAGATFYYGEIPQWRDSFFFATLKDRTLYRLRFTGGPRPERIHQQKLLQKEYGRLRTVFTGPDGHLYVTTSNHDQLGNPGEAQNSDLILRLRRSHPGKSGSHPGKSGKRNGGRRRGRD